jgi:hemoglobin
MPDHETRDDIEIRKDIETRADCERLVRAFYGRALVDPIIGFLFTDVAKLDLEAHVPRITNFWETILLGARSYGGGAFRPHVELHFKVPLKRGHFDRWLYLWAMTLDELFAGERAELAKSHATRVAAAFESRLRSFDEQGAEFAPGIAEIAPGFAELERAAALPLVHRYGRARGV